MKNLVVFLSLLASLLFLNFDCYSDRYNALKMKQEKREASEVDTARIDSITTKVYAVISPGYYQNSTVKEFKIHGCTFLEGESLIHAPYCQNPIHKTQKPETTYVDVPQQQY